MWLETSQFFSKLLIWSPHIFINLYISLIQDCWNSDIKRDNIAHSTCQILISNLKILFLGSAVWSQNSGKKSDAMKINHLFKSIGKIPTCPSSLKRTVLIQSDFVLVYCCLWKTRKLFTYVNILEYFYRHH